VATEFSKKNSTDEFASIWLPEFETPDEPSSNGMYQNVLGDEKRGLSPTASMDKERQKEMPTSYATALDEMATLPNPVIRTDFISLTFRFYNRAKGGSFD
jgi:hypothetical protein